MGDDGDVLDKEIHDLTARANKTRQRNQNESPQPCKKTKKETPEHDKQNKPYVITLFITLDLKKVHANNVHAGKILSCRPHTPSRSTSSARLR